MSMLVAALVFMPLLAISLANLLWAFGAIWPIRSRELLAQAIIGTPGATRVPRLRALFVALFCFGIGVLALSLGDHDAGGMPLTLSALPAAAPFLVRGALTYTPRWRQDHPEPAFAKSDRQVYGPVCLFIGAGLLLLFVLRLI
jgi:hypothetical protein